MITTDQDGVAFIGTFAMGTYYLKETKTADGYNMLTDPVSFTVNADGTVEYTTENNNFDNSPGATYVSTAVAGRVGIYISNPSGAELPMTRQITLYIRRFDASHRICFDVRLQDETENRASPGRTSMI